jgi:hypothetical protein
MAPSATRPETEEKGLRKMPPNVEADRTAKHAAKPQPAAVGPCRAPS